MDIASGKLRLLDVEFDNPTGVYYAGQTLKGRVLVTLDEPMNMCAIKLRISGRAYTAWPDDGWHMGPGGVTERVFCHDEEWYFDVWQTVFGHPPGKLGSVSRRRCTLAEGAHSFPFRFELPSHCPTSFESAHGYIRYVCRAVVHKPWKFDHVAKRAFTLINSLDLNTVTGGTGGDDDDSRPPGQPLQGEESETVSAGCWCLKAGGEVCLKAMLPRTGFVPGERVPIWANVINNSGRKLNKIHASLLQRVRYKSNYRGTIRERVAYRKIAEVHTKEKLDAHWALVWDQQHINLPPISPTINTCRLINVDYGLIYEIGTVVVAFPLMIGTLPLQSTFGELRKQYEVDLVSRIDPNLLPIDLLPLPPEASQYEGYPPPSYGQDTFGEVSIRERTDNNFVRGQLDYAPRYPYYHWPPKDFSFAEDVDKLSLSVFT